MDSNGAVNKTNFKFEDDLQRLIDTYSDKFDVEIIQSVLLNTAYNVLEARKILNDLCGYSAQFELSRQTTPKQVVTLHKRANKSVKEKLMEQAIENYNAGYKLFIILRGLPGSGKSHLARLIMNHCKNSNHISHVFSTDDYFVKRNGTYCYDSKKIPEAHMWNQKRVLQALARNVNPIIIDNTNTCMWEMRSYAMFAVEYGYFIEILEPFTPWCFNVKELTHRNKHRVPKEKIRDMLDRYEKNITTEKLLCAYNLKSAYNPIRNINMKEVSKANKEEDERRRTPNVELAPKYNETKLREEATTSSDLIDLSHINTKKIYPDLRLETWGVNEDTLNAWGVVLPLNDANTNNATSTHVENSTVEETIKQDAFTSVSEKNFADTNHEEGVYYINAKSRDINENVPPMERKIMVRIMLDKSSMTEEEHVNSETDDLRQLYEVFSGIEPKYLADVYQKCDRNLNWTIDILSDSRNLQLTNFEQSDDKQLDEACGFTRDETILNNDDDEQSEVKALQHDEANVKFKDRLGKYRLISRYKGEIIRSESTGASTEESAVIKGRIDASSAEMNNEQLRLSIEEKFKINPSHYSKNIIKIKKSRGLINDADVDLISFDEGANNSNSPDKDNAKPPTTSKIDMYKTESGTILAMDTDADISDYSESEDNSSSSGGDDKFELNLGNEIIEQLEEKFPDVGITYPKGFQPVVQIPMNLARQLHALYIESCFQQLEAQNEVLQMIMKEDEELARKLHSEELNLTKDSHETPNLKEIMDEQAAISVYEREVKQLRQCMGADDLATLLTKQKLKKNFPKVQEDLLMEIYEAHDRNYTETVQSLINSVNQSSDEQERNLMEPPIEASVLQEMKDAQNVTPKSVLGNDANRSPEEYRLLANKYLQNRQELFDKANRYYTQGMFPVAAFYSNLASEQTKLFDQANALAASTLLASNQNNAHTLDLHNLYVKEAINALDIFLDSHIATLRNSQRSKSYLNIITGRGNNSKNGIPKVRPAVMKQLKTRNIQYSVMNPGLLSVKLYKNKLGNM